MWQQGGPVIASGEPQLSVVVPAYNESGRICATLDTILAYLAAEGIDGEIVVVDDGSSDGTGELIAGYAEAHPAVRLEGYGCNRGKGHAVRHGVLASRGDVVLFCDADGSTPISEASKVIALLRAGEADAAIGSRELPESDLARPQPWHRRLMGCVFRWLVRVIVLRGFRDTQCGFKAFRREAAKAVFERQTLDGFAFDVEILFLARHLGYRVVEVPVRWLDSPDSRVRPGRDSLRMACDLVRIRLRALRGVYGERQRRPQ